MSNVRGDLTDMSAETESLDQDETHRLLRDFSYDCLMYVFTSVDQSCRNLPNVVHSCRPLPFTNHKKLPLGVNNTRTHADLV